MPEFIILSVLLDASSDHLTSASKGCQQPFLAEFHWNPSLSIGLRTNHHRGFYRPQLTQYYLYPSQYSHCLLVC